mgnify:CR=1 FL=1
MLSFENDYSEGAHEKILQRFMETNLEKPCVLAEVGKGHYLLLDGNHRLRKAVREKLSCIICYCLKEEQHQKYIERYRPKEYERVMAGY